MKVIDHILHKIDAIKQQREDEEEERYFRKYAHIFDLTYIFFSKNKVLLYGGTALNELMPKNLKIYKEHTLPDIDVFSTNAYNLAVKLVKYFHRKGFDNITTSYTEALHEGTYKVFVDSLQVADITNVTPKTFKRMSENAVLSKSLNINIVNPQVLRMSLHLILSKGDSDSVNRWEKNLKRLYTLYKVYPPVVCESQSQSQSQSQNQNQSETSSISKKVSSSLQQALKETDYVLLGMHEVELLLGKPILFNDIPPIQVLVENSDLKHVANNLISRAKTFQSASTTSEKSTITCSNVYKADHFIPDHICIKSAGNIVAIIYYADDCVNYNEYKGSRIASIHTVIRMYLSMLLSPYKHFEKFANSCECVATMLSIINQQSHKPSSKLQITNKLLKDVVGKCYGSYNGIVTMRKDRLQRIAKKK